MTSRKLLAAIILCVLNVYGFASEPTGHTSNYTPTVLITGANRGIGFRFVRQLALRDWTIIATARNPANATELQELAKRYPNISIARLDVTRDDDIAKLVRTCKASKAALNMYAHMGYPFSSTLPLHLVFRTI